MSATPQPHPGWEPMDLESSDPAAVAYDAPAGQQIVGRLQIAEDDEWYYVQDDEGVIAQFTDLDDARWYVDVKEDAEVSTP